MIKIFVSEKFEHFIPIIALCVGVVVCLLCYVFAKDILPEDTTFMDNLLKGVLCGLSSTGVHQLLTHQNTHIQNKKKNKQQPKSKVVDLKPINFNNYEQANTKVQNLNNYTNSMQVNLQNNEEEPEYVNITKNT